MRYSTQCLVKRRRATLGSDPPSDSQVEGCFEALARRNYRRVEHSGNHLRFAVHGLRVGGRQRCGLLAIVPLNNRFLLLFPGTEASELWLPKSRGFGGSAPDDPGRTAIRLRSCLKARVPSRSGFALQDERRRPDCPPMFHAKLTGLPGREKGVAQADQPSHFRFVRDQAGNPPSCARSIFRTAGHVSGDSRGTGRPVPIILGGS